MSNIGPVEYVILGFPGNKFTGQIVPELSKLHRGRRDQDFDLTFISKDAAGEVSVVDYDAIEELAGSQALTRRLAGSSPRTTSLTPP